MYIEKSGQNYGDRTANRGEIERRHSPRVEVFERIQGHLRPLDIPITVLDLSVGGLCIQSNVSFRIGELRNCRLTTHQGEPLMICARVVHTLCASGPDGLYYVTGLEFVTDASTGAAFAIESLIADLPVA